VLTRAKLAIIPVGSTEQHGPHLRLETDTAIAEALALRIADAVAPVAVVAPPIPVGVSYHHMDFAGTLTLSPDTLQLVLTEVAESLRQHGITHFFFLSGHGGNEATLEVLVTKLRFQRGFHVASLFYFALARDIMSEGAVSERWGHACEVETSLALYLRPDLVDGDQVSQGALHPYPYPYSDQNSPPAVTVPFSFAELTANGAFGDARQADVDFGRAIAETVVERAAVFLRDFVMGSVTAPVGVSEEET
jgi:creatinine amidohydrolase